MVSISKESEQDISRILDDVQRTSQSDDTRQGSANGISHIYYY